MIEINFNWLLRVRALTLFPPTEFGARIATRFECHEEKKIVCSYHPLIPNEVKITTAKGFTQTVFSRNSSYN